MRQNETTDDTPLLSSSSSLFSPRQWETLRAVVDRIIPPDDFPGGWDAGVGDYLARQLSPGGDLAALLPTYRAGLDALEQEADAVRSVGHSGLVHFAELGADAQDVILARVSKGTAAAKWRKVAPSRFFRLLVEHAQEGFYGDPGNGGNRDGAAWKMIGFEVRG